MLNLNFWDLCWVNLHLLWLFQNLMTALKRDGYISVEQSLELFFFFTPTYLPSLGHRRLLLAWGFTCTVYLLILWLSTFKFYNIYTHNQFLFCQKMLSKIWVFLFKMSARAKNWHMMLVSFSRWEIWYIKYKLVQFSIPNLCQIHACMIDACTAKHFDIVSFSSTKDQFIHNLKKG